MQASAADYDSWNAGIVGTGPLIADELLYRLSVNRFNSDGFIKNDYLGADDTNDQDETTIRGKLRWLPGERDTVDLTALYVDIDNGYDAFSLDNTRHTLSDEPGKDKQESTAAGAGVAAGTGRATPGNGADRRHYRQHLQLRRGLELCRYRTGPGVFIDRSLQARPGQLQRHRTAAVR